MLDGFVANFWQRAVSLDAAAAVAQHVDWPTE